MHQFNPTRTMYLMIVPALMEIRSVFILFHYRKTCEIKLFHKENTISLNILTKVYFLNQKNKNRLTRQEKAKTQTLSYTHVNTYALAWKHTQLTQFLSLPLSRPLFLYNARTHTHRSSHSNSHVDTDPRANTQVFRKQL